MQRMTRNKFALFITLSSAFLVKVHVRSTNITPFSGSIFLVTQSHFLMVPLLRWYNWYNTAHHKGMETKYQILVIVMSKLSRMRISA
jgi:hypothetical protein